MNDLINISILIIEETHSTASFLKQLLEKNYAQFTITVCYELEQIKKHIQDKNHDLYFVDVDLENHVNGNDIIKYIHSVQPNAIIVAISDNECVSIVLKSFDAGANNFILRRDLKLNSTRFFSIMTKLINQVIMKNNIISLFKDVLSSQHVFLVKFTIDNTKGVVIEWTDLNCEVPDSIVLFGIKAITTLAGEEETWGEFPVANTKLRAIGYGYHTDKPLPRLQTKVNTAIFVLYPRSLHQFIKNIKECIPYLKKISIETNPKKIQELKEEMFLKNIKTIP